MCLLLILQCKCPPSEFDIFAEISCPCKLPIPRFERLLDFSHLDFVMPDDRWLMPGTSARFVETTTSMIDQQSTSSTVLSSQMNLISPPVSRGFLHYGFARPSRLLISPEQKRLEDHPKVKSTCFTMRLNCRNSSWWGHRNGRMWLPAAGLRHGIRCIINTSLCSNCATSRYFKRFLVLCTILPEQTEKEHEADLHDAQQ